MDIHKPKIKIFSFIISILILILSIYYIYYLNFSNKTDEFIAEGGIFDAQFWDKSSNSIINLNGKWEFYPNVLIEPRDGNFEEYAHIRKYVDVPGSWESYLNEDGSVEGSGTYRLKIKVPEDDIYGIKTRTVRVSSRVFINGDEIISTGNPSLNPSEFEPESKYRVGVAKSENQELNLVFHVSSYSYRSGGIIKPIEFGTIKSIMKKDRIDRGIDAVIISISIFFGIYFFMTYLQRGKDKSLLYFSGTSVFMGIYLSTLNEQLLDLVINYNFMTRTRIQIISMIMVTVCFLKFTYYFFEKNTKNKGLVNALTSLMLLNLIFVFNELKTTSVISLGLTQMLIILGMVLSYIYIFHILVDAFIKKADSSGYILVITSAMASYWFSMIAKTLFELDLGYLSVLHILAMMLCVASLMSHKLQTDYKEVIALSDRLIKNDKLKDEFLAKTSHELEAPIQTILKSSKSLIEGKSGILNTKQQESLFLINQEGKRMTRLVEDLLIASNLKIGDIKVSLKPINAYKLCDDLLREMKALIPTNKKLTLLNRIPENLPLVMADSDKLTQIIYNLVNNGIKYTKSGKVELSAKVEDDQAVFSVLDTGIGIRGSELDDIFDTFYQKSEENMSYLGLGLGLPIVRHLLEIQGGEIKVESTYGKGSCFIFTLPLYEGNEEVDKVDCKIISPQYKQDYSGEKHSILIVDSDFNNQKLLSSIVDDMGYNVFLAVNNKEAIDLVDNYKIDLIVLDFVMSDMYGDNTCKELRKKILYGRVTNFSPYSLWKNHRFDECL